MYNSVLRLKKEKGLKEKMWKGLNFEDFEWNQILVLNRMIFKWTERMEYYLRWGIFNKLGF